VRPSSFSYWAPAIHFYHSDASEMTLDGVKFAAYMTNGDSIRAARLTSLCTSGTISSLA